MKPEPLRSSNHFTIPFSTACRPFILSKITSGCQIPWPQDNENVILSDVLARISTDLIQFHQWSITLGGAFLLAPEIYTDCIGAVLAALAIIMQKMWIGGPSEVS